MSTIDSESNSKPTAEAVQTKVAPKRAKKAKPAKKLARAKKAAKPKADRTNNPLVVRYGEKWVARWDPYSNAAAYQRFIASLNNTPRLANSGSADSRRAALSCCMALASTPAQSTSAWRALHRSHVFAMIYRTSTQM